MARAQTVRTGLGLSPSSPVLPAHPASVHTASVDRDARGLGRLWTRMLVDWDAHGAGRLWSGMLVEWDACGAG